MKRNLLLISGIVALSFSANAQQLKEEYVLFFQLLRIGRKRKCHNSGN